MKIIKLIETSVDVSNPIRIFASPEANLIEILSRQYQGKCYKGCFINRIISIKKRSFCEVSRFTSPNIGTIHLIFEAEVTVLYTGEILNGCRIVSRDERHGIVTLMKGDNIKIRALDSDRKFATFGKGAFISVIVGAGSYKPNIPKISVNAKILIFPTIKPVYTITKGSVLSDTLKNMLNDATERLNKIKGTDDGAKLVGFYEALLSPFTSAKAPAAIPIEDALAKGGHICVDSRLALGTTDAIIVDKPDNALHHVMEIANNEAAIFELVIDIVSRINTVCDYAETYNTRALIQEYKNLWDVFRSAKV